MILETRDAEPTYVLYVTYILPDGISERKRTWRMKERKHWTICSNG